MSDRSDRMRERYARAEARNEAIRQKLEPLEPGERPKAVTIGALIALALAIANAVAIATGNNVVDGSAAKQQSAEVSGLALSAILLVCAAFMWRAKYWAVLGFQALLAIQIIICAGALLVAPGWWQALILLVLTLLGGWLFWSLIRALARLQMPER